MRGAGLIALFCLAPPAMADDLPAIAVPFDTSAPPAPLVEAPPPPPPDISMPAPPVASAPASSAAPATPATPAVSVTPDPAMDVFTQALASAYNTNPQLKAERESLKSLDEGVSQAMSGFRPTIGAEVDHGRQRQDIAGSPWVYSNETTKSLQVQQPLFEGGATVAGLREAREKVRAGREHLRSVEQSVLMQAVAAYVDLAQAGAVRDLARANLDVLIQQRDAVQSRFGAGTTTGTDVAQAEARVAAAQSTLTQAESAVEDARVTFFRVVGYPPGEVALPEDALPTMPTSLEEAKSEAQVAYPELREAEYATKAAEADVARNKAAILPTVALVGSMNREQGPLFPGISDYDADSLTVNVKVPLYQSGAEYSRVRAAENAREQARFTALDTQAAAQENAARAWHDFQAAGVVITSAQAAVKAADTAVTGIAEQYENGTSTTLDMLNTRQELFARQVDLVRARHDRIIAAYRLVEAIGRLTARGLALPVEQYDPTVHYDDVEWKLLGF